MILCITWIRYAINLTISDLSTLLAGQSQLMANVMNHNREAVTTTLSILEATIEEVIKICNLKNYIYMDLLNIFIPSLIT